MIEPIRQAMWVVGAPVRLVLVGSIKLYRLTLSGVLGGQCRFYPSCSHYGEEAVRTHGAMRGSAMTAWRLLRCQPFARGGIDHVPARRVVGGRPTYDGVLRGGDA